MAQLLVAGRHRVVGVTLSGNLERESMSATRAVAACFPISRFRMKTQPIALLPAPFPLPSGWKRKASSLRRSAIQKSTITERDMCLPAFEHLHSGCEKHVADGSASFRSAATNVLHGNPAKSQDGLGRPVQTSRHHVIATGGNDLHPLPRESQER